MWIGSYKYALYFWTNSYSLISSLVILKLFKWAPQRFKVPYFVLNGCVLSYVDVDLGSLVLVDSIIKTGSSASEGRSRSKPL